MQVRAQDKGKTNKHNKPKAYFSDFNPGLGHFGAIYSYIVIINIFNFKHIYKILLLKCPQYHIFAVEEKNIIFYLNKKYR